VSNGDAFHNIQHATVEGCKEAFRKSTDARGGCKILSQGESCECALCMMDRLHSQIDGENGPSITPKVTVRCNRCSKQETLEITTSRNRTVHDAIDTALAVNGWFRPGGAILHCKECKE